MGEREFIFCAYFVEGWNESCQDNSLRENFEQILKLVV
jgi:hypothetical protein